jgi:hypothetical protein
VPLSQQRSARCTSRGGVDANVHPSSGPALAIEAREDGENAAGVVITQEKQNGEEMNVSPGAFLGAFSRMRPKAGGQ